MGGRGSVRRVEPSPAADDAPAVGDGRDERSSEAPTVPRPEWIRPRARWRLGSIGSPTPRARLVFGCGLVGVLAVAWLWTGRSTTSRAAPPRTTATVGAPSKVRAEPVVVKVPGWVPDAIAATCGAHRSEAPSVVTVDCTPGRGVVSLQYLGFSSVSALRAAYAATAPLTGGAGAAACARGVHEERSWSIPASPTVPRGRYRCLLWGGRARLVWTNEHSRVLATATRDDRDVESLFDWWTAVPGPDDR